MRLKTLLLTGIFFLILFSSKAQDLIHAYPNDPGGQPREHNIDVERMFADLHFDTEKGMVMGSVTHYFRVIRDTVDSIVFDGPDIKYQSITLDKEVCKFKVIPEGVVIYPPSLLTWNMNSAIRITYEATPKKGIYFIGFNDTTHRQRRQIWTQGEEFDNRYWIPGYDDPSDKLITEMQVTMDKQFKVLSNGEKLSEKRNGDGTITWHYKISHPHTFYLTMLGIGNYAIRKTKNKRGVPIYEWYYPDKPEQLEPSYRYTEHIMDVLEKEIAYPFPWESYSQIPITDFLYGAMENTTATTFGDFFMVDARGFITRNYIGVNAHEMTHQWFGDLVSARSPRDQWLQESFATYYPQFVTRDLYGQDAYDWGRYGNAQAALGASKADLNPIVGTKGGGARIYNKGAFVLGMLSNVVGHDDYQRAVKAYLTRFAYKNANTNDFYLSFYDALGLNLDWFFDEWLYRGGEPDYHIRYDKLTVDGKQYTQVYIDQVQKINEFTGYFKMPVRVEVHYKDGTSDAKTEWVETEHHIMKIPDSLGKEIDYVLFDPNYTILKHVTFDKSFEEWQAQALRAPHMLDKYEALLALRAQPVKDKIETLTKVYNNAKFHALREEILNQLADDKSQDALNLFKEGLADKEPSVRVNAVRNTHAITELSRPDYEPLLKDSSYDVVESVLEKLCDDFPANDSVYLAKTNKVMGLDHSLRITWLRIENRNAVDSTIRELVDYTSNAFEFRTRTNAFKALQQLNYLDDKSIRGLLEASLSWNGRLANPAKETLEYFGKQHAKKSQILEGIDKGNWTAAQKEKLRKLFS
jgi:aminopeptidase N